MKHFYQKYRGRGQHPRGARDVGGAPAPPPLAAAMSRVPGGTPLYYDMITNLVPVIQQQDTSNKNP